MVSTTYKILAKPFKYLLKSTNASISRKGLERLDFLLLLIESLEINGVDSLLKTSKRLGLDTQFSNRVELWKTRAYNPLRKASRRGSLSNNDVDSMITLISLTAERIYPVLRQLLSNKEPEAVNNSRWNILISRFNELVEERMNIKRVGIRNLLSKNNSYNFIRELVFILSISIGPIGIERLKSNIYNI
tara:strand:- start:30478 stop:31044 length:567 start_codon:yes stop_codon:yes gene_type:complete